jgi:uncharacterized protein YjbI with pentapeptide repeats
VINGDFRESRLAMANADNRTSGAGEQTPPKIKAEDNPWYLLATLYGEPELGDYELQKRNRIAWNRYFAAELTEKTRTKLIEEQRHAAEELAPYSPVEVQEMAKAFAERCKAVAKKLCLPASHAATNFSNVEFEQYAFFERYFFGKSGSFSNATFCGGANFADATFFRLAPFKAAAFSGDADFSDAAFSSGADFSGATFSGSADFRRAAFSLTTNFEGATFSHWGDFTDTTFSHKADFSRTTFSAKAHFERATFSAPINFNGATFSDVAEFVSATFSRGAIFENATFRHAIFKSATFSDGAKFANATFQDLCLFVNVEMKGMTSFENATFETEPPQFSGAKLHEGTVWRGIKNWPTPGRADGAGVFVDAYERLKLEMDRLKKHEDELNFFAHLGQGPPQMCARRYTKKLLPL